MIVPVVNVIEPAAIASSVKKFAVTSVPVLMSSSVLRPRSTSPALNLVIEPATVATEVPVTVSVPIVIESAAIASSSIAALADLTAASSANVIAETPSVFTLAI